MYPPDREGILILKNGAGHPIPFTQSFIQGDLLLWGGVGGWTDDPGS